LRLNPDGSIPSDNPVLNGVQSHVFTYGHRNMQGLAFGLGDSLYGVEHGPKSDDEINALTPGGNYGWPHVAGFQDNKAYVYGDWSAAIGGCTGLAYSDVAIPGSVPIFEETDWAAPENFVEPLATMFTVPPTHEFSDPDCDAMDFICWPTIAPSSVAVYPTEPGEIPGWRNSLIISSLKNGALYRIGLDRNGDRLAGPLYRHFRSENRYRDLAIHPEGLTIYVATDSQGLARSLDGGVTDKLEDRGAILAFTYIGSGADN
jgi:PQQ-dependent dehydrogenase (s-GDH family)